MRVEDRREFRRRWQITRRAHSSFLHHTARRQQLEEARFALWVYKVGDPLYESDLHTELSGLALPPDHPFWARFMPPNGWGCFCYVVGARSADGAKRLGGDPEKALPTWWDSVDGATGLPPGVEPLFEGWAMPDLVQTVEAIVNGEV